MVGSPLCPSVSFSSSATEAMAPSSGLSWQSYFLLGDTSYIAQINANSLRVRATANAIVICMGFILSEIAPAWELWKCEGDETKVFSNTYTGCLNQATLGTDVPLDHGGHNRWSQPGCKSSCKVENFTLAAHYALDSYP